MLQHRLPIRRCHDHTLSNLLRVGQKFAESHDWHGQLMRPARGGSGTAISVGGFVEALDEVTCLLKFNRQEERGRGVDALQLTACCVGSTRFDIVGPETYATRVSLAIQ